MAKKLLALLIATTLPFGSYIVAQATDPEHQYTAFEMRSNGKIYVVVGVILIILIGMFLYLLNIDRKIRRMEKDQATN